MQAYTVIPGYERYEICNVFPHRIRRRDNHRFINEYIERDCYYRLNLVNDDDNKRKKVYKHVIVAKTFIENDDPVNKTVVDHINHIRIDNRIANLRWCTRQENSINRSRANGVTYQFVSELPLGCVKVTHYNKHQLEDIYFHLDTNVFYKKMADHLFRIMHQSIRPSGSHYVISKSTENRRVDIYNHVVRRDIDTYQLVDDEGDAIDEAEEEQ